MISDDTTDLFCRIGTCLRNIFDRGVIIILLDIGKDPGELFFPLDRTVGWYDSCIFVSS